ncbi:hypothetical protein NDI52_16000 [Leptolyngbya sp. PL-A3]|nr:hypothetical protein [Leptolyngbya sp. FACHB-8]MBD1911511.1 hypothetical protein [Leptolyngbya sp. FACHB-8]
MEFWEFLIQREGDRSWLPLESPDVEVLEGRYRMVARTSRVNQPVEIRICHIRLDEDPPRRRTQKRNGRINDDGLIVIFPFTWLQPGVWELSCAGDLMADMLGQGWRYGVQLSVLPQESEVADDWEPDGPAADLDAVSLMSRHDSVHEDLDEAGAASAVESLPEPEPVLDSASSVEIDEPNPFVFPEQPVVEEPVEPEPAVMATGSSEVWQKAQDDSDAVIDSLLEDLDLDLDTPVAAEVETPENEEEFASGPALKPESVQLVLQQSSLVVQAGRSLTLQGTIEPVGELDTPYLPPVALQITLRDPQTASTVLEVRRSLTSRLLPCPFSCQVTLPENSDSRLLIGDVALVALATPTDHPSVLVSAGFSVTASLNDLLEAVADDFPADLYPPLREDEQPVDLDITFLIAQRAAAAPLVRPAGEQILPPQIYQPDPNRPRTRGIELPMEKLLEPEPEIVLEVAPELAEASADTEDIALDAPSAPETPSHDLEEADGVLQRLETSEATDGPSVVGQALPEENLALSAEELAFRALDLQSRFLSRLSALAGDRELSQFLGNSSLPLSEEGWDEQEIVLDDELPPPTLRNTLGFSAPPSPPIQPDALPEEEPLPTPQLRVTGGELVSGQRVEVTVQLPPTASRLGVKLWMQDLQSRVLLDGPRWVMNFLPNGHGNLEAWTTLTVPHGCLEVQFEAIAVELTTQRESHKASVDRPVVPPDLPTLSFDELEI